MGTIAEDIKSTFPNEQVKALINIKYTANWLNNIGNDVLKPFKITVQQYNILRILRGAKEPITVNTIRERMIEKSPNATRLMDKLCEKNLIGRTRCEHDRRVVYIKISKKGLQLLANIPEENLSNPLIKLSVDEAQILNELLDKIRKNEKNSTKILG